MIQRRILLLLSKLKSFTFWIFILSISIRILLALYNREANDDHITVIKRMLEGLPVEPYSCWECFQPKFYYETIVQLAHFLSLSKTESIIILAQIVSSTAGVGTLLMVWLFLKEQPLTPIVKNLTFAFFAFNPDFIGITNQATNDSFVIFFGTLAIYSLWKFFNTKNYIYYLFMVITTIFSALTKVTGIILFLSINCCLFINIFYNHKQFLSYKILITNIFVYILSFTICILLFSPYIHNYQKLNNPFVTNIPRAPPPHFLKVTKFYRPGITSIAQGYFSFNFINLIEIPYSTNGYVFYPKHRTSLWSEMYGRFYSIHFPQWPPSWQDKSSMIIFLTRIILLLAILPTCIILLGLINEVLVIGSLMKKNNTWIFLIVFLFFIASLIYYTYIYRDSGGFKPLYLYPSILSIVLFFVKGEEYIEAKHTSYSAINTILIIFIFFEIFDITLLLTHLMFK